MKKKTKNKLLQHVVGRLLGLVLFTASPLLVVLEFVNRYTDGRMEFGEFVDDVVEFYDNLLSVIVTGKGKH